MTHRIGVRGIARRAHTINPAKMRTGIPKTIKHTMYMNAIAIILHISAMLICISSGTYSVISWLGCTQNFEVMGVTQQLLS